MLAANVGFEFNRTPMPKVSAGILMYRNRSERLEFLLVHLGGPFWRNKDAGAWSIPKGEVGESEETLNAAKREFAEELGHAPEGRFISLSPVKQKGGKIVHAWAVEGDFDASRIKSNHFEMEWPPGSGKSQSFPEVDRAEWFGIDMAKTKINPSQIPLLEQTRQKLEAKEGQ